MRSGDDNLTAADLTAADPTPVELGYLETGPGARPVPDAPAEPPRVTAVTYRRLHTFGSCEHEAVEATAAVAAGEDPGAVLAGLRGWVNGRLGVEVWDELEDAEARLSELKSRIAGREHDLRKLDSEIRDARLLWQRARDFLNRFGIDPDRVDNLPF